MYLRDALARFKETKDIAILSLILERHGKRGFVLACKSAGMPRGVGKRMLASYDNKHLVTTSVVKMKGRPFK